MSGSFGCEKFVVVNTALPGGGRRGVLGVQRVSLARPFEFYGIGLEAVKWNETCLVGVCGYSAETWDCEGGIQISLNWLDDIVW